MIVGSAQMAIAPVTNCGQVRLAMFADAVTKAKIKMGHVFVTQGLEAVTANAACACQRVLMARVATVHAVAMKVGLAKPAPRKLAATMVKRMLLATASATTIGPAWTVRNLTAALMATRTSRVAIRAFAFVKNHGVASIVTRATAVLTAGSTTRLMIVCVTLAGAVLDAPLAPATTTALVEVIVSRAVASAIKSRILVSLETGVNTRLVQMSAALTANVMVASAHVTRAGEVLIAASRHAPKTAQAAVNAF